VFGVWCLVFGKNIITKARNFIVFFVLLFFRDGSFY